MIKETRRPHNFLITNMIIADMILTLWSTIPAGIAIIMGYVAGRDVIHFGLLNFTFHWVIEYHLTFAMMSTEKGFILLLNS